MEFQSHRISKVLKIDPGTGNYIELTSDDESVPIHTKQIPGGHVPIMDSSSLSETSVSIETNVINETDSEPAELSATILTRRSEARSPRSIFRARYTVQNSTRCTSESLRDESVRHTTKECSRTNRERSWSKCK